MPAFSFLLPLLSAFICVILAHPHGHVKRKRAFSANKQPSLPTYHENAEEWTFLDTEPDLTLNDVFAEETNNTYEVVYDLINRVLGSNSHFTSQFILELIDSQSHEKYSNKFLSDENIERYNLDKHPFWMHSLELDVLELNNNGTNGIILRGSSTLAIIGAFKWYLQEWCNTTYDWRTYTLDLPVKLPLPSSERRQRSVPFSYYENVCTVSYSQAFWTWTQWEPHLDWMAMQG